MACSITLSGLARDCSPNMGGIVEVYIANFADVNTVTVTDNVITAISMANSAKFKAYSFRKNTGSLTSTLTKDTAAGITFVTSDLVLQFSRKLLLRSTRKKTCFDKSLWSASGQSW